MDIEKKLAVLDTRLRAAEDQLEILHLLSSYGPLVDSGSAREAAALWVTGGGYDFDGGTRVEAPQDLVAVYEAEKHLGLVNTGVSHLTATPRITVNGDTAEAVGYSFVILKEGDHWCLWRSAINHWALVRTPAGWRIKERLNRVLNGSPESHDIMRRALA